MTGTRFLALLLLLAAVLFGGAPASACPMCKGSITPEQELKDLATRLEAEKEKEEAGNAKAAILASMIADKKHEMARREATTRGFFYSILFMLLMPATLLGAFATTLTLSIRRARARQLELLGRSAAPAATA